MAKKFIDVFLQGYTPKDPAGQRFVKKHIVAKTKDADGNKDDVFQATNVKVAKYPKSSPDLYEAVEPLDELSKHTLASYIRNAAHSAVVHRADAAGDEAGRDTSPTDDDADDYQRSADKHYHKINKRLRGINRASRNLVYQEEAEDLEELSRHTLMSYSRKAGEDIKDRKWDFRSGDTPAERRQGGKKINRRVDGMVTAAQKLGGNSWVVRPTKEDLDPSMGADAYIDDFVHSKNPKFEGKSRKERIKMALGAFYGARKEHVEEDTLDDLSEGILRAYYKAVAGKKDKKAAMPKLREEINDLVELSRKTLGNYIRRGAEDMSGHVERSASHELGRDIDRPQNSSFNLRPNTPTAKTYHDREADRHARKAVNREMGIKMAASKLTGVRGPWTKKAKVLASEDTDLNELSGITLQNYIATAATDSYVAGMKGDANRAKKRIMGAAKAAKHLRTGNKPEKKQVYLPRYEETEQIDELSKGTLGRYIRGATSQMTNMHQRAHDSALDGYYNVPGGEKRMKKTYKRETGVHLAAMKLSGSRWAKIHAKEEAENLDELSHKTLHSYIDKAVTDVHNAGYKSGESYTKGNIDGVVSATLKSFKRHSGIRNAAKKLSKDK